MTSPLAGYLSEAGPWLPLVQPTPDTSWLAWVEVLAAAGVRVIEIPLRNAHAVSGLRTARQAFPDLVIAAGTICTVPDARAAIDAGAHFLVSPGVAPELLHWTDTTGVPWLPGVASATDLMHCQTLNHSYRKFFPAMAMGGAAAIQALSGPFPALQFVPSGGIGIADAAPFLASAHVCCVSASWGSAELGSSAQSVRHHLEKLGS